MALVGEAGVGKSRLLREFARTAAASEGSLVLESGSMAYGNGHRVPAGDRDHSPLLQDRARRRSAGRPREGDGQGPDAGPRPRGHHHAAPRHAPGAPARRARSCPAPGRAARAGGRRRAARHAPRGPDPAARPHLRGHALGVSGDAALARPRGQRAAALDHADRQLSPDLRRRLAGQAALHAPQDRSPASGPAGDLLDALLGESAELAPLKKLLIDRTDGNPLFLEECVRSLVETHVLVGRRGQLSRDHGAWPTSRSPRRSRRSWPRASTDSRRGRSGCSSARRSSARRGRSGSSPRSATSPTTLARDPRPPRPRRAARGDARERFRFRHSLTHAVTYETLLHERRRQLHGAIAQAMERLYAEPPRRAPGSPRPSRLRRRAVGQGRRLPAPGRGALARALRGPGGDGLSRTGAHGPALPAGDTRDHAPGRGHPARAPQRPPAVRSAAGDLRPPGRGPAAGRDRRGRAPPGPRPRLPQQSLLERGRSRPRHRVEPAGPGHRRARRRSRSPDRGQLQHGGRPPGARRVPPDRGVHAPGHRHARLPI